MNVLFVLGTYLPKPSPNGICVENVARELVAQNNNVVCLCTQKYYDTSNFETVNGADIYRVKGDSIKEYYFKLQSEKKISIIRKALYHIVNLLRKIMGLLSALFWPHDFTGWSNRLYIKAESLHEKYNFDIVVAVYAPIVSLTVGYKLKENHPDIVYLPYFIDAFSGGHKRRTHSVSLDRRMKTNFEKKYLSNADRIISMQSSKAFHEKFNSKAVWFKNLIYLDVPLFVKKARKQSLQDNVIQFDRDKTNIVFCGQLNYPYRNIKYLIELFLYAKMDNAKLIFIGNTNRRDIFNDAVVKSDGTIEHYDAIAHEQISAVLESADILLNLGVTNASTVSGKIFEYMAYAKPIIATYSIDDEACLPYLREYPCCLLIDERDSDLDAQSNRMKEFIASAPNSRIDINAIAKKYYLNTPEAFADMLKSFDD